jgi:hypothetical protein
MALLRILLIFKAGQGHWRLHIARFRDNANGPIREASFFQINRLPVRQIVCKRGVRELGHDRLVVRNGGNRSNCGSGGQADASGSANKKK